MTRVRPSSNAAAAYAAGISGIAFFSIMDMVIKGLTLSIGAYPALLWRSLLGVAVTGLLFLALCQRWPSRAVLRLHLRRGINTAVMSILFFWGLGKVPMAQAVALSFIAPLIALGLAALLLDEKIGRRTVAGSLAALAGVAVILIGQARAELGPQALLGSIAILISAMLYAWNLVMLRQQALAAGPVEIAFFTNLIVSICFVSSLLFVSPVPGPSGHWLELTVATALAISSQLLLAWAYARAGAAYLSTTEYSSLLWAMLLGWLRFGEPVSPFTLAGAALIVGGCLFAAAGSEHPALEASA